MNKRELLKQRLGYDPAEAPSFRTTATLREIQPSSPGLAATPAEAVTRINSSRYVKKQLAETDVFLHTIEAASSRFIPDRWAFLAESTLRNIAADSNAGIAFMTKHATGGLFSSGGENPYGRTFAGYFEPGEVSRTLVQLYMLRAHNPNGTSAPSTDDLNKGIEGGTLFDVSCGLSRKGAGKLVCDVCSQDLFTCNHMPGTTEDMNEGQIAAQKARGVPGGKASYSYDNFHAAEISIVHDGALPGAGTAFANDDKQIARPREEEKVMYSKELKVKLGLAETATDAEVEAKLAALQSSASKVTELETQKKAAEDATFEAKFKDKLTPEEIGTIKPLSNRDAVATMLVAKGGEKKTPPVGDPLKGTSAAAAPGTTPVVNTELQEDSEEIRKIFGTHKDNTELEKAVMTAPMAALAKCLGVKLHSTPEHVRYDERALRARKSAYGVTTV